MKSELKMKHDAQIILYRSYRQGDLPDIQITYSSLISPLQAVAQVGLWILYSSAPVGMY